MTKKVETKRRPKEKDKQPSTIEDRERAKCLKGMRCWDNIKKLDPDEYTFQDLNDLETVATYMWEIFREASFDDTPPFARLSQERRQGLINALAKRSNAVEELPLHQFKDQIGPNDPHLSRPFIPGVSAHLLKIDWRIGSKEKIMQAFEKWIKSNPSIYLRSDPRKTLEGRGRKRNFQAMLRDLAIYRVSQVMNYAKGSIALKVDMSEQKWCDAKKRAKQAIERFVENLIQTRLHAIRLTAPFLFNAATDQLDLK